MHSSGMSARRSSASLPWARVAGAAVTAQTEKEGKGRTIPFICFKANIFVVFPCIVCFHGKKNSQLFFFYFLNAITPFSYWILRKEYCKAQVLHLFFFFQFVFFPLLITVLMETSSSDSSVMPTVFSGRCYFGVHPSRPTCKRTLNFKFANAEIGAGHCACSGGEEDSPCGSCSGKEVLFFSGQNSHSN